MNNSKSKGRSRPNVPNAHCIKAIAFKLEEAIALENLSKNNIFLNKCERNAWEVTLEDRDKAVNVLRFLKVWFDVEHAIYFTAVHYLDQFLARMKVQQKYLACISVSCFYLAASNNGIPLDGAKLVYISQSKCSVKDMNRMCNIIKQKLNLNNNSHITSFDFLISFMDILDSISVQVGAEPLVKQMLQPDLLAACLEIIIANSTCAHYKPSMISLALIQCQMEQFLIRENPKKSMYYSLEMLHMLTVLLELQHMCKIKDPEFVNCYSTIWKTLEDYNTYGKNIHCQKLAWRFSTSTCVVASHLRVYRPSLEIIQE